MDLEVINNYYTMGILDGVTTNPTMARKFNMADDMEMISNVRKAMPKGEIHVEAFGDTTDEILSEVSRLGMLDDDLVFKIPFTVAGVQAVNNLKGRGCPVGTKRTNMHLIFSHNQALLASKVKSDYICPLVGRLDDEGHEGLLFIEQLVDTYFKHDISTKIMVSSVRNPMHVIKAFKFGADAITIPPKVLDRMFEHHLTTDGFKLFKADLEAMKEV